MGGWVQREEVRARAFALGGSACFSEQKSPGCSRRKQAREQVLLLLLLVLGGCSSDRAQHRCSAPSPLFLRWCCGSTACVGSVAPPAKSRSHPVCPPAATAMLLIPKHFPPNAASVRLVVVVHLGTPVRLRLACLPWPSPRHHRPLSPPHHIASHRHLLPLFLPLPPHSPRSGTLASTNAVGSFYTRSPSRLVSPQLSARPLSRLHHGPLDVHLASLSSSPSPPSPSSPPPSLSS